MATIVILHPGAMGVSIGAALADHEVRWVADGRSAATAARAAAAGLVRVDSLGQAVEGADVVFSVCPPASAVEVARAVAATSFAGTFIDANAVAPSTMTEVVGAGPGTTVVDGGIVGPPAHRPGTTRLFLSGEDSAAVAELFAGSLVHTVVVDGPVGAASATKVAYAAWTKGSSALLLAVATFAEQSGVTDVLRDEWARSQPDLAARLELVAAGTAPKAWRFAGELADSGRAFAEVGLPDGFGAAAADIYERLAGFRDQSGVGVDDVLDALTDGSQS